MTSLRQVLSVSVALTMVAMGGSAVAQSAGEMTVEEIQNAFNLQQEAFSQMKTRGLVIAPTTQTANTSSASTTAVASTDFTPVDEGSEVFVNIAFDLNSAAVREDQKPKLVNLCTAMQSVDVAGFQIIGHTDSSGSAAYNQTLSLSRAQEVKRYMVTNCGIAEDRLEAIGMGENALLNPNNPRGDENRRVEFQVLG